MEKTICIFGDSITWGASDYESGGWPQLLRFYFENNDYNISLYNQGVSGDSTEDLLLRFNTECQARKPQIIIFAIGINDSQYINSKNNHRVTIEKFHSNIIKLIHQAEKFSHRIIFIEITKVNESMVSPVPWNIEKFYDNDSIKKYNIVIKKVCEEMELGYVPMFDVLDENMLVDGLHPDSAGHKKMFEQVSSYLIENKII